MRLLLLVLLTATLSVKAAPLVGATGRADEDLGQIIGFTKGFSLTRDICNEKFPDLLEETSTAVEEWEKRNANTIHEANERWEAFLQEMSEGDRNKYLATLVHFENESKRIETAFRLMFDRLPAASQRSGCTELPANLAPGVRELEDVMKYQLLTVRKSRPMVSK